MAVRGFPVSGEKGILVVEPSPGAKKMASDDLLVEVNTKQQSDALLKLNLVSDYKCQRSGHGSRNCRGRDTCAKCSSKEHVTDACNNEPHCANCGGNHPAYSRSCPVWKDEKEVVTLKVTENITYTEAKKRFAFVSKGTYAEAVRRGPARPMVSMGTQTSPDDLHLPSRSPSKPPGAAPVAPPPNRKVNAALPASTPEQEMTSPAQPAASTSRGRGLPPHTSAPQRKPGEVPKQSTSKGQLPATADEPMDEVQYGDVCYLQRTLIELDLQSSERVTPTECPSCNISQNLARARKDGCFFTMLSFQDQLLQVINQTKETLYDNLEKLKEDAEEPFEIVKDITSAATYKKLCKAHVLN
ncbi:hypothetical protein ISCGN_007562 [Ixodes scapularis]